MLPDGTSSVVVVLVFTLVVVELGVVDAVVVGGGVGTANQE